MSLCIFIDTTSGKKNIQQIPCKENVPLAAQEPRGRRKRPKDVWNALLQSLYEGTWKTVWTTVCWTVIVKIIYDTMTSKAYENIQ